MPEERAKVLGQPETLREGCWGRRGKAKYTMAHGDGHEQLLVMEEVEGQRRDCLIGGSEDSEHRSLWMMLAMNNTGDMTTSA